MFTPILSSLDRSNLTAVVKPDECFTQLFRSHLHFDSHEGLSFQSHHLDQQVVEMIGSHYARTLTLRSSNFVSASRALLTGFGLA